MVFFRRKTLIAGKLIIDFLSQVSDDDYLIVGFVIQVMMITVPTPACLTKMWIVCACFWCGLTCIVLDLDGQSKTVFQL